MNGIINKKTKNGLIIFSIGLVVQEIGNLVICNYRGYLTNLIKKN